MSEEQEDSAPRGLVIAIASGKGGTGKTTVAVNMAAALARSGTAPGPIALLDCDVEAPNAHLFVHPTFTRVESVEVLKPVWDADLCAGCGRCADACNSNALAVVKDKVLIFQELCHACGACSYICPEGAMREEPAGIGVVESAPENPEFSFAHGKLNIGEPLAPAIVRGVKARAETGEVTIIDAAPGTACPVVEAVRGADVALLVTEPTPFGLHDLTLAAALTLELGVPTAIVVNRSDGADDLIEGYALQTGIPLVGRIPFERKYAEAYSRGELLVDAYPELAGPLLAIFGAARALVGTTPPAPPDAPAPEVSSAGEDAAEPLDARSSGAAVECTIISGKGGTGKTTVAASLAVLASGKVLADCDVDAADLHLLLPPTIREARDFVGGQKATIRADRCTGCGKCAEMCHFRAIACDGKGEDGAARTFRVDSLACEGCGLCELVCPADAVRMESSVTGQSYVSDTSSGPMSHARLGIAEENSGKLVTKVRNAAAELVRRHDAATILADGSPGTGCPVIASISGTDLVLIVTEPTVAGVHDMGRVLELCRHFAVPAVVCINKADLNADQAEKIRHESQRMGARVIGEIPFDRAVNDALMAGKPVVEWPDSAAAGSIRELWTALRTELESVRDT